MFLIYIRYTDCTLQEDGDIVKTEFFETIGQANIRRAEVLEMAIECEDIFFDNEFHIIEYSRQSELVQYLNELNSKVFKTLDFSQIDADRERERVKNCNLFSRQKLKAVS